MTDYTKRDASHAGFTVALQDGYARAPLRPDASFRNSVLPNSLQSVSDLNILSPNPLCRTDIVLVSAGQYLSKSTGTTIFTTRDRSTVTVYGDSGGYQFIKGQVPWLGDETRREVLDWLQQHADYAMTLDIPTAAIEYPKSGFGTYDDCLATTLDNLRFFDQQRSGRTRFLNVLQGRTPEEADNWYAAVKDFDFSGWAIAGRLRLDPEQLCRRVVTLVRDGKINERQDRIHILGTAQLSVGVMLTALQRALREHLNLPTITITFDSGAPFLMAGMHRAYTEPRCEPTRSNNPDTFRLESHVAPCSYHYIGSKAAVPFRSPIASGLVNGDLCVKDHVVPRSAWDGWSSILLANHNLSALYSALNYANSIMDLETVDAEARAPLVLVKAVGIVRRLFRGTNPMSSIKRHRVLLSSRPGDDPTADDGAGHE